MKVFCKNCRYHKWVEQYAMVQVCKFSKWVEDHPECMTAHYVECSILNANNNCKDYKNKWFISIAEKFKKDKLMIVFMIVLRY